MLQILKSEIKFSILYFIVLVIDIYVKLNLQSLPYRYISKPLVILLLFLFYYFNTLEKIKNKKAWVVLGLFCFLLGDLLIINHTNLIFLSVSLLFFALAKIFLSLRFSHKLDFDVIGLIPFSIAIFAYTVFIVSFLYDSVGDFLIPVLCSFFLSILFIQFAFLRRGVVSRVSYLYVFYGALLYMLSESMVAIKTFKTDLPFQDILIMLFYGIAVYLIVFGIVKEDEEVISVNLSSHTSSPVN
jgi:uncharacterized membrane protein YhhN